MFAFSKKGGFKKKGRDMNSAPIERKEGRFCLIVTTAFLLFFSLSLFSAELVGRVTDERGGGVSSALVLVSSNSSFSSRVFVFTGKGGFYHIKGLSPGWYYIRAEVIGFGISSRVRRVFVSGSSRVDLEVDLSRFRAVEVRWAFRGSHRDILKEEGVLFPPPVIISSPSSSSVVKGVRVVSSSHFSSASFSLSSANYSVDVTAFSSGVIASGRFDFLLSSSALTKVGVKVKKVRSGSGSGVVAGIEAEEWLRFSLPVFLRVGVRYDRYRYLSRGDFFSPWLEVIYFPREGVELSGLFSRRVRSPEGVLPPELSGFFFGRGKPERSLRYQFGVKHTASGGMVLSLIAFYDDVEDHIINLYLPSSYGIDRVMALSVGNVVIRGVELGFAKRFLGSFRGRVRYSYEEVLGEGDGFRLLSSLSSGGEVLSYQLAHDLVTSFEGVIKKTGTSFEARYLLNLTPLFLDEGDVDLPSRLDLKLVQDIPPSGEGRWQFFLVLNNLLNDQTPCFFTLDRIIPWGKPRRIKGGFTIIF